LPNFVFYIVIFFVFSTRQIICSNVVMVFTFFFIAFYHVYTYQHIMSTLNKSCEKRTRQLTIKGQTMFDEQQEQLYEKCENIWIKIEDLMITVPSCHKLEDIRQLNKDIEAYYKNVCRRSEEYKGYLYRANTVETILIILQNVLKLLEK